MEKSVIVNLQNLNLNVSTDTSTNNPVQEPQKIPIVSSKDQTKEWRQSQPWYIDGKRNECENYQRSMIEKIIGRKCKKTNTRLNTITFESRDLSRPLSQEDGFEWTEDFDGLSKIKNYKLYFDMKMISSRGGAQTRSLREVYHFINAQSEHLIKYKSVDKYFINILDGMKVIVN